MRGWASSQGQMVGSEGVWSTNSSSYTYYLLAFHSVNPKLANLGDGVQTAVTDLELLFSIVAELVAMIVFGVLAGMLSSWISAGKVGFPPLFLRFSIEKCRNCPFFRAFK